MQRTSYSIQVIWENGLTKTLGLQTAMKTFRRWDSSVKSFMPNNQSLKDARKILKIARTHFPEQTHRIIKTVTKTTILEV